MGDLTKSEKALKLLGTIQLDPHPAVMGLYLAAAFGAALTIGSLSMAEIIKHMTY